MQPNTMNYPILVESWDTDRGEVFIYEGRGNIYSITSETDKLVGVFPSLQASRRYAHNILHGEFGEVYGKKYKYLDICPHCYTTVDFYEVVTDRFNDSGDVISDTCKRYGCSNCHTYWENAEEPIDETVKKLLSLHKRGLINIC